MSHKVVISLEAACFIKDHVAEPLTEGCFVKEEINNSAVKMGVEGRAL